MTRLALLLLPVLIVIGCGKESSDAHGAPVTTPSGLSIQELRIGTGEEAIPGRYIALHYDLKRTDGTPLTSTRAVVPSDPKSPSPPFVARLGSTHLIAGFNEGLPGMRAGGRRRLVVPPALAYGALGKGKVPGDVPLDYEVELIDVFTRTESGLEFRVVVPGSGAPPATGQWVTLKHRVWLVDCGREITSWRKRSGPLEFQLGDDQALPGLAEAVARMPIGAQWQLALPPELAYGPLGHLPYLPPATDVMIDVELVSARAP